MNTQLPTIAEVLASSCTSYWLANALRSALKRDIVDAANDAQILAEVLADWCADLTSQMHNMTAAELRHWNANL
jgi:hypothetical protein